MLADRALPGALSPLSGTPESGLHDLDRASALREGMLTLIDLAGASTDILYAWMADAAVLGRIVLVADGSNFLDAYRLAAAARRRAAARFPDASRVDLVAHEEMALERVRLARGFTAYQIQSIVEDILPSQASEDVGLIVAPGLLDMYLDDELSREESQALATRALATMRRLAGRLNVPAIVSNSALSPKSDHPLRVLLEESVDEQVVLRPAPLGGMVIQLPRRGAAFFSPGPGRTRLEDFLAEDQRATPIPRPARRAPGAWISNGNRMYGKFGEQHRRADWAVHEAREAA